MKNIETFGRDSDNVLRPIHVDTIGDARTSYNFRDIIATGSATLTRATETTVLTGVADTYLDLILVGVANSSTVAQTISLRAATGGGVEEVIHVGASNTAVRQFTVPHPQSEKACAWTAQNTTGGEISDSPVTVDMHALKYTD